MKFRPLHDRVGVKRIDAEDKTAGGIIIPDSARRSPRRAKSRRSARVAATKPAS
jgi:chaperonin GroES